MDGLRRSAATQALLLAALPSALIIPTLGASVSWLAAWADGMLPGSPMAATLFLVFTICFLAPVLLALPLAAAGGALARSQRRAGTDIARASAAGTGLAAFLLAGTWLVYRSHSVYEFLVSAPLMVGACAFVAVAGSGAFLHAGSESPQRRERVPTLYQAMGAGAINGLLLFAAACGWLGLSSALGFPTPEWITGLLPTSMAEFAWYTVAIGALAPVSRMAARAVRRTFKSADPRALGLGLAFPALVPGISNAGFALLHASSVHAQAAVGCAVGGLLHALAIAWGLRESAPRTARELPDPEPTGLLED